MPGIPCSRICGKRGGPGPVGCFSGQPCCETILAADDGGHVRLAIRFPAHGIDRGRIIRGGLDCGDGDEVFFLKWFVTFLTPAVNDVPAFASVA